MNDARKLLKATPIKKLKARIDEDNSMLNNGNAEFLSLEDGKLMKIRIFPAHPDHDNFYVPRKCYWLPFTTDSGDERRGTVLDSIFHGKTAMDIVQEYVAYVKTHGSENAVAAVTAQRDGLLPSLSWLCYAAEVKEDDMDPKLWEFKKTVRDAMNRLAITEEEDEPIETDPFTDPDEGLPLFVKYIKNPNKKKGENYYDVSLGKKPKACPLTDEAIEKFMKLKPIEEVAGTYTLEMFERALEGLQNSTSSTVSTSSATTSGWRLWRKYVPSTATPTTNPRRKSPRKPPSVVTMTTRMTFRPFVRRRTAPVSAFPSLRSRKRSRTTSLNRSLR